MTLENYCKNLPEEKLFNLAIRFAKLALPVWNKYTEKKSLTYRDGVVWMKHTINNNLLEETIKEVELFINTKAKETDGLTKLYNQFTDPLVALQDEDLKLPDDVEKIFYSVNNLLEAALGKDQTVFDESSLYVSINQSIESLELSGLLSENEIKKILNEA